MEEQAEADVMNDEWRTRGGSIWNHNRQPSATRVKCRATTCQLVQLVKFMEKHKELAVSHTQPFPGSEQLWEELADHINQFGPPKNPKQCKTTWRDLRKRAFAMMRARNKDKQKSVGRNLYGMAPKIISLIAAAGGLPKTGLQGMTPDVGAGSSKVATAEVPIVDKTKEGVIKVERTSSGDQLVIRVTDKQNSKSNVFNSFSVSDGHFENNIIVKEEREDPQPEEEASETMETEEERIDSVSEGLFPAAEALLGNQDSSSSREVCKALKDLNQTLQRFVTEYAERTLLQRERIDLDRARLQFDMEVFHRSKKENDSKSDS